jgi:uncharacterized protein (DUF1684 family)
MHRTPADPPTDRSAIGTAAAGSTGMIAELTHQLEATRRAKDDFFARSAYSPLSAVARHTFNGLSYYAPDPTYRLTGLRLEPADDVGVVPFPIETSDRRQRTAYRLGRLRFVLAGQELSLTAYQIGETETDVLFVPFKDRTNGSDTYPAGRYLDIEPGEDGTYVVDFNLAYHPYCAYSDSYSCPLPPVENHLPVRIEAGERLGAATATA